MGKYASSRNYGYGKKIAWAGKQALISFYGNGHFASVATHVRHWEKFSRWLHCVFNIGDACEIDRIHVEAYAGMLRELVQEESMKVSYAQNLLSGVNITLEALRGDSCIRIDSPSKWVGRRCTKRVDPPTGYDWKTVLMLVEKLIELNMPRAAAVVWFARSFGARLRECVLADIGQWNDQAKKLAKIDIRNGTKGGRGNEIARWVTLSERGKQALAEAIAVQDQLSCGNNLLRPGESYDELVNDRELNRARQYLHEAGIKGYHDLRSAWACERYLELTGNVAPVYSAATELDPGSDRKAREILALELGHDRIDVVAAYIGARTLGNANCKLKEQI
ncbi:MAG: integrase domain-containing protein [Betaproteobacteria bacterium]|nr:integrase domain-containing protein [Betaproteobacteria bacterium]